MGEPRADLALAAQLQRIGITVFERGWLSSNNVLIQGVDSSALVDSGYSSHSVQTCALVRDALQGKSLDMLLNTHLHSDHCGGNAALQATFQDMQTWIPPGQAASVAQWDPVALTYEPTGQTCPSFSFHGLLTPGKAIRLGDMAWEVHAAKGHDPHSVVLFEPTTRVLISADALWESGFGIVFPELDGIDAFDEVAATLNLIEVLDPQTVIPGHGSVFQNVGAALTRARSRLDQFVKSPELHRRHALKVLIKFKLLEWQSVSWSDMLAWYVKTPFIRSIEGGLTDPDPEATRRSLESLIGELATRQVLRVHAGQLINI